MKAPVHSRAKSLVAFILVIVGFQLLRFGYRAAERILLAHRDHPDTVYVVDSALAARLLEEQRGVVEPNWERSGAGEAGRKGKGAGPGRDGRLAAEAGSRGSVGVGSNSHGPTGVLIRRNAPHERAAERIVSNSPRRKVENFRFNPNTATLDDFRRLGFTDKQAQSIDNYRQKGGRFRRKSDFARSYVVSDSVFARLEPYIDIPLLDLNRADSADFDALPGIGGYFARQMVQYRERLGGSYSDVRQLLDIYHFTPEKLDAIADLITVDSAFVQPYPLWTYPIDSLRKHPAIGNYSTARSIVFFREHNPREHWTVSALQKAGVLTPEQARRLSLCKLAEP